MRHLLIAFCLFALPLLGTAHAQERLTSVELVAADNALMHGEDQWLGVRINIAPHWHVYWKNPGDSGIPTEVRWETEEGVNIGPIHWPTPQTLPFDFLTNYGYEDEVILPIPVRYNGSSDEVTLTAHVDMLVCKDICIPESDTVSITLPVDTSKTPTADAAAIKAALAQVPTPSDKVGALTLNAEHAIFTLPVENAATVQKVAFFPLQDGLISNSSERKWARQGDQLILTLESTGNTSLSTLDSVVEITRENGKSESLQMTFDSAVTLTASQDSELTFWVALWFAFLGGIILNAMPCVFPILSLKALSIAKQSEQDNHTVRRQGLAYTAGILVTFAAIATPLLVLQQAGSAVGWGFQLQSPIFVMALALIVFVVGLSLSGLFHVPSLLSGVKGPSEPASLRGNFFTGVLSTLVATPCTAPFMASALGFALSQPPLQAMLIFQFLGLGLAAPYLLISYAPAARKLLPKPGAWMGYMQQLLAFPMYATAAWLLWVLVQQTGENGMLWALMAAIMIAAALWSLRLSTGLWKLLWFAAAGLVCFYAAINQTAPNHIAVSFSPAKIEQLRGENKAVFVYATAAWCITCKVNENTTLHTQQVQQFFTDNNITVIKADWTNRGDVIRDYLASFNRNGIPVYVYYAPGKEPILLPQILTPALLKDTLTQQGT